MLALVACEQIIGKRGLVAQEYAKLEERPIAATDLGEANHFLVADDYFVWRQCAVTGVEQQARGVVCARAQSGNIGTCFGHFDAASTYGVRETVTQPAVGLRDIFGGAYADRATDDGLIEQECSAAGVAFENLYSSGSATL